MDILGMGVPRRAIRAVVDASRHHGIPQVPVGGTVTRDDARPARIIGHRRRGVRLPIRKRGGHVRSFHWMWRLPILSPAAGFRTPALAFQIGTAGDGADLENSPL